MVARALLLLACALLAVPALFVGARGVLAVRRRTAVIQGRTVVGGKAIAAGLVLVGWAVGMLGFAALVFAAQMRR
ncbi:MAG TPA: hypothetical protein VFK90_06395 [Anaeromyxobacter sp.]|nr:hypothetical protein [Anaeromyxobacter sp.]